MEDSSEAATPVVSDSGTGRDFFRIAVYLFLVTSSFGFLQPFLPLYMEATGLARDQIGQVTGFGAGLALIIQPILGRLSDRFDARRPFIAACAATAAGAYFAFPYAQGYWTFLALVAIGTNGTMYLNAAGGVLVGRLVQAARGGAMYGGLRLWGSIGYIITTLSTGWLVSETVKRHLNGGGMGRETLNPVFHLGPFLFLVIVCVSAILPDRKSAAQTVAVRDKAPLSDNLRWFLLAYFLYIFALYGASGFLSLFLKGLGATGFDITKSFAAGVVVEVLVMRWAGQFSDRYGRRPALAFSFVLLPIRLLLYMPATGPLWVMMVQSLHGVNFGIMGAVAVVFVNDLATDRTRGHAQARLFAVAGLATSIGPIVFGTTAKYTGLANMFGVAAIIAVVAAGIFLAKVQDSHEGTHRLSDRVSPSFRPLVRWLEVPLGR